MQSRSCPAPAPTYKSNDALLAPTRNAVVVRAYDEIVTKVAIAVGSAANTSSCIAGSFEWPGPPRAIGASEWSSLGQQLATHADGDERNLHTSHASPLLALR
jgi:hypothetical protein